MEQRITTKYDDLKAKIISLFRDSLDEHEEDITTGIEDGIYEEEENEEYLQNIEDTRKLIEEFEQYTPKVYVYVEGGNIQGASATEAIVFNVFDKDNYMAGDDQEEFIEAYGAPDEWNEMIDERTKDGELISIY